MATEKMRNVRVDRGPKNLSCQVMATTDIFKVQPILMRETKANDIWSVKHRQVNICESLSVPSFVDVKCRNSWFYVPYSKVWQPFESMLAGTTININDTPGYKFTKVPTLSPLLLLKVLTSSNVYCQILNTVPSVPYDFRYSDSTGSLVYGIFTSRGRRIINILQGLGYKFSFFFDRLNSTNISMDTVGPSPSLMPLFAYVKIFGENFVPSKYADKVNDLISRIYNYCGDCDVTAAIYDTDGYHIGTLTGPTGSDSQLLLDIFALLVDIYYGDDYFTSSPAESMTSPDGLNQSVTFTDITVPTSLSNEYTVTDGSFGTDYTPVHKGINSGGLLANSPRNVSDYIHNMLHILTKNIQLKALSGSKLAQRIYALYGTKSQTYNMQAVLLDQDVSEVEVKAITSVADTTGSNGAALGQKGGQMNNYAEKGYHYEFSEFGALICVNQVIPNYFYGQGLHREMLHVHPDDFYNDRFALAGYQNIANFELFADDQLGYYFRSGKTQKGSWGKTSAYAEYALRKDNVMGDFSLLSRMLGYEVYHYNRFLVDQVDDMNNNVAPSLLPSLPSNNEQFLKVLGLDNNFDIIHQYDRIFTDTNAADDHIAQWNDFKITVVRDGRNINDFTIGEEDGREIELAGLGHVLYN